MICPILKYRHVVLSLLCLVGLAGVGQAQEVAQSVFPERFVRIRSLQELTEDGVYLLGAAETGTISPNGLFLMERRTWQDNKKRPIALVGTKWCDLEDMPEVINETNPVCFWRMEPQANGQVRLYNAEDLRSIYSRGETFLEMSASQKTLWGVDCEDGCFTFRNANVPNRYIGLSYQGTNSSGTHMYRFANYTRSGADAVTMYVYKGVWGGGDSAWEMPEDGSAVTFSAGDYAVSSAHGDGGVRVTDYELRNGTLASCAEIGQWTFVQRPDSCFLLLGANGTFLSYAFSETSDECLWHMRNGGIYTHESRPRQLLFNGRFFLSAGNEQSYLPVSLRVMAERPDSTLSGGVKRLSGGWSAHALSRVAWDGVDGLDLTAISLPVKPEQFSARPVAANTVVYVAEDTADEVPSEWTFTVARNGDAGRLLTPAVLYDRLPLRLDCDVAYSAGQLAYVRQAYADGLWETLYVPFPASVPSGFNAETNTELVGEELIFEAVDAIEAYTPVIIRYAEAAGIAAGQTVSLKLSSASDGWLQKEAATISDKVFQGTMDTLRVTSLADGVYLLNVSGDAFVRASEGSGLMPFRAGLKLAGSRAAALRIHHENVSAGIDPVSPSSCSHGYYYSLKGVPQRVPSDGKLPPGIWIFKNQKLRIR